MFGNRRMLARRTRFKSRAILRRDRLLNIATPRAGRTPHNRFVAFGSSCVIALSMGAHRTHSDCIPSSALPKFVQSAPKMTGEEQSLR